MTERQQIDIREVLDHLGIQKKTLDRLREEGLFEEEWIDSGVAEDLRVAMVLLEELGVNPPGVQVALHLRRRLVALEARVSFIAEHLREQD
jgi:hypothetical protein